MSKTGAELLIESLIATGVKHLFSLSGNQILSLYDASIGRDINLIHTRHEAAAVHMADGWGRLTEQPGVALLTAGPGHCNAISALYGALMAESPVVLLSGHSPHAQIGSGAFQEIDQVATAKPVTKAAWLVEDPNHLDEAIAAALSLACEGRPGPGSPEFTHRCLGSHRLSPFPSRNRWQILRPRGTPQQATWTIYSAN